MSNEGPLKASKLIAFVPTRDMARAKAFYQGHLGLELVSEDGFALAFNVQGTMLRVTLVQEIAPAQYTVLGWEVSQIADTTHDLVKAGIVMERFSFFPQDELGVWTAPDGTKVAWFKDPDGNLLSVSQHL